MSGSQLGPVQADGQSQSRMQFVCNMTSPGWFCGIVHRKQVSFILLLLLLGLVRFSRVHRVGIGLGLGLSLGLRYFTLVTGWGYDFPTWSEWSHMSGSQRVAYVSWNLVSLFSTNMAISVTKGQGWRVIFTQWRKASDILTSTLAAFSFSSHPKGKGIERLI